MIRQIQRLFLCLPILLALAALPVGCSGGEQGSPPGVHGGKLSGCPGPPNCISTESHAPSHYEAPLTFRSSPGEAFSCLRATISGMKRTNVVKAEGGYLHLEFRTKWGFVDDVEFLVDDESHTIQMRSASRTGYWDFGVNRKRIQRIRDRFNAVCH